MGKKDTKRFIFNCDWQDILQKLPDASRLKVLDAVIDYVRNGNTAELDLAESIAFDFICKEIDWNNDKYEEICKKRSEAGKKGNEKRWGRKQSQDIANVANATFATFANRKNRYNDNKNKNELSIDNKLSQDNIQKEIVFTNNSQKVRDPYKQIVALWNEMLGDKLPKVQIVTEKRKVSIKARLSEFGEFQNWLPKCREIFGKIGNSRFMCGENSTNWKANFDWLFGSPNNWVKVVEGNYDKSGIRDSVAERMHYEGEHNPHAYDEAEEYSKWQEENVLK